MTRKHYEAIARAIRTERSRIAREMMPQEGEWALTCRLSLRLADTLAHAGNARFDRERFLTACGLTADEMNYYEAEERDRREAVLASLRDAVK